MATRSGAHRAVGADLAASTASGLASEEAKQEGFGPGVLGLAGGIGAFAPGIAGGLVSGAGRRIAQIRAKQGEQGALSDVADSLPGGVSELRRRVMMS